jgi:hypothetical protein
MGMKENRSGGWISKKIAKANRRKHLTLGKIVSSTTTRRLIQNSRKIGLINRLIVPVLLR